MADRRNVSIARVDAIIGISQLGLLFTDWFQRKIVYPIVTGVIACVALALVIDLVILGATRLATPWQRAGR